MSGPTSSAMTGRTSLTVICLVAPPDGTGEAATARLQFTVGGQPLHLEITVPAGPTPLRELLPVFQGLTNTVVDVAIQNSQRQGKEVSCRVGCAACCRQLIPVSEAEAHALARLVDALPDPRRATVRERFAAAHERLAAAGLLAPLRQPTTMNEAQQRTLSLDYFRLGLACPFLEEEACSIYADRPLGCREYLVTSPAEACSRLDFAALQTVPLPTEVGSAVRVVNQQTTAAEQSWVPLVLALEWAADHPAEPPLPGPVWLEKVFSRLARKPVSATEQKPVETAVAGLVRAFYTHGTTDGADLQALFLDPTVNVIECEAGHARCTAIAHWAPRRPAEAMQPGAPVTTEILQIDVLTPTLAIACAVVLEPHRRTRAVFTVLHVGVAWRIAGLVLEYQKARGT